MAAANTQNPTVTIEIDVDGYRKVTPKVELKEGEQVTFDNQTKTPLTIWFPEGKPFGLSELPVDSPSEVRQVKTGTSRKEPYPYAVYCHSKKDFCYASAMPIIIIHPRT